MTITSIPIVLIKKQTVMFSGFEPIKTLQSSVLVTTYHSDTEYSVCLSSIRDKTKCHGYSLNKKKSRYDYL